MEMVVFQHHHQCRHLRHRHQHDGDHGNLGLHAQQHVEVDLENVTDNANEHNLMPNAMAPIDKLDFVILIHAVSTFIHLFLRGFYLFMYHIYFLIASNNIWLPWAAWGDCTRSCGTGQQIRRRKCSGSSCSGDSIQVQQCSNSNCNGNSLKLFATVFQTFL